MSAIRLKDRLQDYGTWVAVLENNQADGALVGIGL